MSNIQTLILGTDLDFISFWHILFLQENCVIILAGIVGVGRELKLEQVI